VETIAIGDGRTLVLETVTGFLEDEQQISEAALGYGALLADRVRVLAPP